MKNIKTLIGGAVVAAAIGGAAAIAATNSSTSQAISPSTIPVAAPSGSTCPSQASKAAAAPVSYTTQTGQHVCECSKKESGEAGKTTAEADKSGKKDTSKAESDKNAKDKPATTA